MIVVIELGECLCQLGDECYTELQEYEQFNIVQSPQVGFVDGDL